MIELITFILAINSVIPGGSNNEVSVEYSFAFGNNVTVNATGGYVTAFYNSANPGKLGINEPNPEAALHVNGTVKISQILHLEPIEPTGPPSIGGSKGDICVTDDGKLWFYVDEVSGWKEVQLIW